MNFIIIAAVIVLAFIVLKFIARVIFKLISFIIVVILAVYLLFYWNGGFLDLGNHDFMLYELEKRYCNNQVDEVKCDCIIQPLLIDINEQYDDAEIEEAKKNKILSLKMIAKSMARKRTEIKDCLSKNGADSVWSSFINEIKEYEMENKIDETLDKILK